jgi:hypothetical protein
MLVLRLVCNIARHRKVTGGEAHHVRCSRCGMIAGPFDGSPCGFRRLRSSHVSTVRRPWLPVPRLRKGGSAQGQ